MHLSEKIKDIAIRFGYDLSNAKKAPLFPTKPKYKSPSNLGLLFLSAKIVAKQLRMSRGRNIN